MLTEQCLQVVLSTDFTDFTDFCYASGWVGARSNIIFNHINHRQPPLEPDRKDHIRSFKIIDNPYPMRSKKIILLGDSYMSLIRMVDHIRIKECYSFTNFPNAIYQFSRNIVFFEATEVASLGTEVASLATEVASLATEVASLVYKHLNLSVGI